MRFLTSALLIISLFYCSQAAGRTSLPVLNCDTLTTTSGQVVLVNIVSENDSLVNFRYCSESESSTPHILRRSEVKSIRKSAVRPNHSGGNARIDIPESAVRMGEGSDSDIVITKYGEQDSAELTPAEEKKLVRQTKLGALFSFGSLAIVLLSFVINPLLMILFIPAIIFGVVLSSRAQRKARGLPKFAKHYKLAKASKILGITILAILGSLPLLWVIGAIIFLIYLILTI